MSALALKIPPPVQMAIAMAAIWLCAEFLPLYALTLPATNVIAMVLFCVGMALVLIGFLQFRQAGTTINPLDPNKTSQLVTSGLHRYSRNPMYLGELLLLIAWTVSFSNLMAFVFLPLFVASITYLQIMPEEKILLKKFGKEYATYKSAVRRWI